MFIVRALKFILAVVLWFPRTLIWILGNLLWLPRFFAASLLRPLIGKRAALKWILSNEVGCHVVFSPTPRNQSLLAKIPMIDGSRKLFFVPSLFAWHGRIQTLSLALPLVQRTAKALWNHARVREQGEPDPAKKGAGSKWERVDCSHGGEREGAQQWILWPTGERPPKCAKKLGESASKVDESPDHNIGIFLVAPSALQGGAENEEVLKSMSKLCDLSNANEERKSKLASMNGGCKYAPPTITIKAKKRLWYLAVPRPVDDTVPMHDEPLDVAALVHHCRSRYDPEYKADGGSRAVTDDDDASTPMSMGSPVHSSPTATSSSSALKMVAVGFSEGCNPFLRYVSSTGSDCELDAMINISHGCAMETSTAKIAKNPLVHLLTKLALVAHDMEQQTGAAEDPTQLSRFASFTNSKGSPERQPANSDEDSEQESVPTSPTRNNTEVFTQTLQNANDVVTEALSEQAERQSMRRRNNSYGAMKKNGSGGRRSSSTIPWESVLGGSPPDGSSLHQQPPLGMDLPKPRHGRTNSESSTNSVSSSTSNDPVLLSSVKTRLPHSKQTGSGSESNSRCSSPDKKALVATTTTNKLDALYRAENNKTVIRRIAIPTLFIHAEDDPIVPFESVPVKLLATNPNITQVITPHGGHCAFLETTLPFEMGYFDHASLTNGDDPSLHLSWLYQLVCEFTDASMRQNLMEQFHHHHQHLVAAAPPPQCPFHQAMPNGTSKKDKQQDQPHSGQQEQQQVPPPECPFHRRAVAKNEADNRVCT